MAIGAWLAVLKEYRIIPRPLKKSSATYLFYNANKGDAADDNDLHSLATLNVLLEGIGEPPETTLPPHLRGVELTPQLLLDAAEAHAAPMGRRHGADPICSAFMKACPDELEWASSTADAEEAGRGFRLANGGIYSTAHDLARFASAAAR